MPDNSQKLENVILQLPAALRERAEEMAARESLSLNTFLATAVAEKLLQLQLQQCLGISDRDQFVLTETTAPSPAVVH
jgi:hypothetical protein